MSKDRFDLEQDIMNVWNTADDIRILCESFYDSEMQWTQDRMANALIGLAELVDARADKCFRTFEQVFELNQYCKDEQVLRNREIFEELVAMHRGSDEKES